MCGSACSGTIQALTSALEASERVWNNSPGSNPSKGCGTVELRNALEGCGTNDQLWFWLLWDDPGVGKALEGSEGGGLEGSGGRFQGLRGVVERSGGVWAQSGGRLVWHVPKP